MVLTKRLLTYGLRETMNRKTWHEDLLERYIERGLRDFEQDEVLQMLLGYVLSEDEAKRKSRELLLRLGSITSVMDMRVEGLVRVGELSEKSATLLNMLPKVSRRYYIDNLDVPSMRFDDLRNIGAYCTAKYMGSTDEVLAIVLVDEKAAFMGYEVIQTGSFSRASVNIEKMAEILFAYDAPYFILIHNHPDPDIRPSDGDVETTYWLELRFRKLGKRMLEHIIVFNNRYMPVMKYMIEEDSKYDDFHSCKFFQYDD